MGAVAHYCTCAVGYRITPVSLLEVKGRDAVTAMNCGSSSDDTYLVGCRWQKRH